MEDSSLTRLRYTVAPPPELLEPLYAFHGTTRYSFNSVTRLDQKLDGLKTLLQSIKRLGKQLLELTQAQTHCGE